MEDGENGDGPLSSNTKFDARRRENYNFGVEIWKFEIKLRFDNGFGPHMKVNHTPVLENYTKI